MPKYKIAVAFTTAQHLVHIGLPVTFLQMMNGRDWSDYHFEIIHKFGPYVQVNRNFCVKDFLEKKRYADCQYFFFWDWDNGLMPNAFDLFMEDMENPEINIITGNYYRKETAMRAAYGIMLPGQDGFHADPVMFVQPGIIDLTTHANSVSGMAGCGCMMIRREVLEKVSYPWFECFHTPCYSMGQWAFETEDVYFCTKAQEECGYHIHLDTRIISPHYSGNKCWPEPWRQYGFDDEE